MTVAASEVPISEWPLFGLELQSAEIILRLVRETDLARLAAIQPEDYEHDPRAERFPGEDIDQQRRRLVYQGYWRSLGEWSPSSWCLDFAVEHRGEIVGVQSLEAKDFLSLRTVDSGSWLIERVRGRGVGVAMRAAVLSLAFDHLGALAAVTSARHDNHASLGVSRHLGYQENGISLNESGGGVVELRHRRLTIDDWQRAAPGHPVEINGLTDCLDWFGLDQSR